MSNDLKSGQSTTTPNTSEQKPGVISRLSAWQTNNPNKSTAIVAGATFGAIKGVELGVRKVKEHFAEKSVSPAKEQAAAFVGNVARGFGKRFG